MPDTPNEARETAAADAATGSATTNGATTSGASTVREDLIGKASAATSEFRTQAADSARDFAEQGKARATGALDEISRLISDNARQVDGAIGEQYGDYVRRAADAVSGFSGTLRDKDVDELIEDVRSYVRASPALAMGAAAAAGFFLARVIKSGSEAMEDAATRVTPRPTSAPAATDGSERATKPTARAKPADRDS